MAEFAGNYQDLINDLLRRTEESRKVADARGIGEAQRRGMVGSDVEMSLRNAQTAPVVQGGQSDIANILADIAKTQEAQKYGTSERIGAQQFQTGENVAQRGWQTGEREAGQTWGAKEAGYIDPKTGQWISSAAGEALKGREWTTGERTASETAAAKAAGYLNPDGTWRTGAGGHTGAALADWENIQWSKPPEQKKKSGWQSALGVIAPAVGTVAGTYAGTKAAKYW